MVNINLKIQKYKNQLLAAVAVNLIGLAHGTFLGWVSPALHILNSENSPFDRKITRQEESWIGSCVSPGAFTGNLLFGLILDWIGRKYTLLLVGIPNLLSFIVIYFSSEVYHLYIARFLGGLTGGGLYCTVPIYIAEIADPKIRGALGSMLPLISNIGLVVGYSLTAYVPYSIVPIIVIWTPIISVLLIAYLPETPRYLLLKGREAEAEKSLKFYTNFVSKTKVETQKFAKELEGLKELLANSMKTDSKLTIKDFCNPVAMKSIFVGVLIMIHNQITGTFVILNYAAKIFSEAGTTLDPNICAILIGVAQVIGTYIATMLVDHFGRKPLFNISLFGMLLGFLATGSFDYFIGINPNLDYSWIPIVGVTFIIFTASLGVIPLPIFIIVEMCPGKIRSYVSIGCMMVLNVFAFLTLKAFPLLLFNLNLYGVMWLCAFFCVTGILFCSFFITETKGKVLQEEGVQKPVNENRC